jgi:hypothetical protein
MKERNRVKSDKVGGYISMKKEINSPFSETDPVLLGTGIECKLEPPKNPSAGQVRGTNVTRLISHCAHKTSLHNRQTDQ